MQQFSNPIADQSAATSLLEKTLSRKCKLHKQYACEYLHTIPSDFSPRLCCLCIEERNIPASEFVFIKLLLQASTNTTFNAYPKLNDNSISKKIELYKNTNVQIQEDLQTFFDNLKSTISLAIEKKRSAQQDQLASLQTSYQRIFDSLSQISQVENLQELIKNDNEDELQSFINDQFSRADTYTSKINNNIVEYQKNYERFSLSDPNNKLNEIVKLIEGIEFFPTNLQSQENNSQQQPSLSSQPQQQQESCKNQQQQQKDKIEQSTSSQSAYAEYISLVKRGVDQGILLKWLEYGQGEKWWYGKSFLSKTKSQYADTQEEWLSFTEEERQKQLSILKKEVGPSN